MKLSDFAGKTVLTIVIIAFICTFISMAYYHSLDFIPFMIGVFLGSCGSIAKVFLLERTVNKVLTMEKHRVGIYAGAQHILRFLLSGFVLFLGATVPQINLWGAAIGILAFQPAIYIVKFTSRGWFKFKNSGGD